MIQARHVSFSHLKPIFTDINFNIGDNQIVGIAGPNGA